LARGKGVKAFALVTPQQLAENPDKILRMWQYAGDAERRDLGEPAQRMEMTAAHPSPVRTAEPRTPGVGSMGSVGSVRNDSTAKENACSG
jgi:hypothetical protein